MKKAPCEGLFRFGCLALGALRRLGVRTFVGRVLAVSCAQVAEMRLAERAPFFGGDLAVLVRVHRVEALCRLIQELLPRDGPLFVFRGDGSDGRSGSLRRGGCLLLREGASCSASEDGRSQELLVHLWNISSKKQAHACAFV